jgi:two-component system response regulator PilR (NtrC family)
MGETARILVIDDEENIRKTISMTLRHAGYEVDTAENGRQAIQKSEMNFYNLALIDIRLPDMEGTELLTALKDTTPKMIKVILTGFPGQQNAITAINKGVDAYLIKPVSPGDLLRVVKERLEKQREEMAYSQDKIAEFVESRFKELETKERGAPAKRN